MSEDTNVVTLPDDNRSPQTRYLDDVTDLARMASITFGLIEKAFCPTRAIRNDKNIYTFNFSENWTDDIHFALGDVVDRARSLSARRAVISGEDDE